MSRRFAFAAGLIFAGIATAYGILSRDAGGATMLACLSIGMTVMWYVLLTGSARES
ncbi:MAG TPA: hypothetical protein VF802_00995 [Candidatus Limnocylindrales bacterium]